MAEKLGVSGSDSILRKLSLSESIEILSETFFGSLKRLKVADPDELSELSVRLPDTVGCPTTSESVQHAFSHFIPESSSFPRIAVQVF